MQTPKFQVPNLKGKIAVVTGSSRGVGKGIASVLGQCGATVYVTGRSTLNHQNSEGIKGTIEETAQLITSNGGYGIAVPCDHTKDEDVSKLFEKVKKESGKIDLLVNSAWPGYENYDDHKFDAPFWQQPFHVRWNSIFDGGLKATMLTCYHAVPLMLSQKHGVIINITAWEKHNKYLQNLMYDTAKSAINRMTFGLSEEVRKEGIAVISLGPGWTKTERVVSTLEKHNQHDQVAHIETAEYSGRAVASLFADEKIMEKSGKWFAVGDVAAEYDFTDIDGRYFPAFEMPDAVQ